MVPAHSVLERAPLPCPDFAQPKHVLFPYKLTLLPLLPLIPPPIAYHPPSLSIHHSPTAHQLSRWTAQWIGRCFCSTPSTGSLLPLLLAFILFQFSFAAAPLAASCSTRKRTAMRILTAPAGSCNNVRARAFFSFAQYLDAGLLAGDCCIQIRQCGKMQGALCPPSVPLVSGMTCRSHDLTRWYTGARWTLTR